MSVESMTTVTIKLILSNITFINSICLKIQASKLMATFRHLSLVLGCLTANAVGLKPGCTQEGKCILSVTLANDVVDR